MPNDGKIDPTQSPRRVSIENRKQLYLEPQKPLNPQPTNNRLPLKAPVIRIEQSHNPQSLQIRAIEIPHQAQPPKKLQARL